MLFFGLSVVMHMFVGAEDKLVLGCTVCSDSVNFLVMRFDMILSNFFVLYNITF